MSDNTKILVRNAREHDLPAAAQIYIEAFPPSGTTVKPETFLRRLMAFPNGFVILVADNEITAFGCSEKWLTEGESGLDKNPLATHQPDGRIFCITALAIKQTYQSAGYGLLVLDKLIETAHNEGCRKVILETTHAQDLSLQRGFKVVQNRTERGIPLAVMALEIESYGSKA